MAKSHTILQFSSNEKLSEILVAELGNKGYDSFLLSDDGLECSISKNLFDEKFIISLAEKYETTVRISEIVDRNWNKEWEQNYDPILVDDFCLIKASFHDIKKKYPVEITINPKMSFGTGHHETTYLMVENEIKLNFKNKSVLDAGTGTGILSIIAEKLGANDVTAFDIDSWSYENTMENIRANGSHRIKVFHGDTSSIPDSKKYDIVLANINLNIILDQLNIYKEKLKPDGLMVLSGFLLEDEIKISKEANSLGLNFYKRSKRGKWLSLIFNNDVK